MSTELFKLAARGGAVVAAAAVVQYAVAGATHIALARLLAPEWFGQLALAALVVNAVGSLANLHGDKFVVRARRSSAMRLDAAFTVQLLFGGVCTIGLLLAAPLLTGYLGHPELTLPVQLLAATCLYHPLALPRCEWERELSFVRARVPQLVAQIGAGLIAITLAWRGGGLWSLVVWRLGLILGELLMIWLTARRWPRLRWNQRVVRGLLSFGLPLLASGLLVFFYYNIDYYIVGRLLPDAERQLGYYWLAFQMGHYLLRLRTAVFSVMFPVMSRLSDAVVRARLFDSMCRAAAGLVLVPLLLTSYLGRDLITWSLGARWEPAWYPLQWVLIAVLLRAVHANTSYYLIAQGVTRAELFSALLYAILLPPLAIAGCCWGGITGTAIGVVGATGIVVTIVFHRYVRPQTGRGLWHFCGRPLLVAAVAFGLVWLTPLGTAPVVTRLLVLIAHLAFAWLLLAGQLGVRSASRSELVVQA